VAFEAVQSEGIVTIIERIGQRFIALIQHGVHEKALHLLAPPLGRGGEFASAGQFGQFDAAFLRFFPARRNWDNNLIDKPYAQGGSV